MAAVYLAYDIRLARRVAVKVMFPELRHQPGMSERFLRESQTAASLDDHPNVVRVYRAHDVDGLSFFAMKYIDGCSLDQLLQSTERLPIGVACQILGQVALALQYAHDRGVVHRDVKPSNVMLDQRGTAIVTDFGIARVAEGEQLTSSGVAIGTPSFMSPEQWRTDVITAASDQYALGIVTYVMVAGKPPFGGTAYEIQEGHLHGTVPSLSAIRPDCPPELEALVGRMLAKRPGARWLDLATVHDGLATVPRPPAPSVVAELELLMPRGIAITGRDLATPVSPIPLGLGPPPAAPPPTPAASRPPRDPHAAAADAPATASPVLLGLPSLQRTAHVATPRAEPVVSTAPSLESPIEPLPEASLGAGSVVNGAPGRGSWGRRLGGAGLALAGIAAIGLITYRTSHREAVAPAPTAAVRPAPQAVAPAPVPLMPQPTVIPDTSRTDTTASAATTADRVASPVAPGPPAAVRVFGTPADGRLSVGDSVPLWANVVDSAGLRVPDARVEWTSGDSARLVWRRPFAIARSTGPVTLTARAGPLARRITLLVSARVADVPGPTRRVRPAPAVVSSPSPEVVAAAIDSLVARVEGRRVDDLASLGSAPGDESSAHDFLRWLVKAKGVHVVSTVRSEPAVGSDRATVELTTWLTWRAGLLKRGHREAARFRISLGHADGRWHADSVRLIERFSP
jgi:serine/threonine-protein kinase